MNWYEEKKLREENEAHMQELKEKNPELYEKYQKAFAYVMEKLKGVSKDLADR